MSDEEASMLFLRLRFQLETGNFAQAQETLRCFTESKAAGESIFREFSDFDKAPLGLARIPTRFLNALQEAGIETIGDLRLFTAAELGRLHELGPSRVASILRHIEQLRRDWVHWMESQER